MGTPNGAQRFCEQAAIAKPASPSPPKPNTPSHPQGRSPARTRGVTPSAGLGHPLRPPPGRQLRGYCSSAPRPAPLGPAPAGRESAPDPGRVSPTSLGSPPLRVASRGPAERRRGSRAHRPNPNQWAPAPAGRTELRRRLHFRIRTPGSGPWRFPRVTRAPKCLLRGRPAPLLRIVVPAPAPAPER